MAKGLHVLFSAHGVPESYIEAGDPYQRHIEECVRLISKEVSNQLSCDSARPLSMCKEIGLQLAGALTGTANVDGGGAIPAQFHLSFQSRVGPVQWLK
jgi:protoheme ferro-lyase